MVSTLLMPFHHNLCSICRLNQHLKRHQVPFVHRSVVLNGYSSRAASILHRTFWAPTVNAPPTQPPSPRTQYGSRQLISNASISNSHQDRSSASRTYDVQMRRCSVWLLSTAVLAHCPGCCWSSRQGGLSSIALDRRPANCLSGR